MNDFTKDELEGILEGLQIIDADPGIIPKIYWEDSLKIKIKSMIDNYDDSETVIVRGIKRKLSEFIKDEKEDKEIK